MENTTLTAGSNCLVRWEANPKGSTPVKSNHVNGRRTKKIVLPDISGSGPRPKPGEVWVCRVEREVNGKSDSRGVIVVRPLNIEIDPSFPGVWVDPLKARLMSITLQNPEKNLMLVGEQGIGKSTLARAVCTKLGWKFRKVSGGMIKKFVYMLGRFLPSPEKGQMGWTWVDSPLVKIIREAQRNPSDHFLCMIDEFSRMDEDARDVLLDVIEGEVRILSLPNGEELVVPRNITFMAAANEGGAFTVRKEDAAAKDRWVIVKLKHMPQPDELAHCLMKFPNAPKTTLDKGLTIINRLRTLRFDLKVRLSKTVSTRGAQNLAMFLAAGIDLETALTCAVTNQFEGSEGDTNSEAGRVAKIISDELKK